MSLLRRLRAGQSGFSMVTVMMVMLVAGLFATAGFAAADGDLPQGKASQDSKDAYAAAEAGVNFYAFHLAQDNGYWTKCTNVPAPNATEPSPVVNKWYGAPDADPRTGHWRNVPGTGAKYAIELLPSPAATGTKPQCIQANESTMLDPNTGMFRIRVTGRKGARSRTIVASFRRKSLLDFLWLTNFETKDPLNYSASAATETPTWAAANCTDYRSARSSSCDNQQFLPTDQLLGPFHSNDSIWTCDATTFGRTGKNDTLEVGQPYPGWYDQCGSSTTPNFRSTFYAGRPSVDIPPSNSSLKTVAQNGGVLLTGLHRIHLEGDKIRVDGGAQQTVGNGVVYAQSSVGGCATTPPMDADYADPASCGNLYVSGTYSTNITLASDNDVIVAPVAPGAAGNANILRAAGSDAVLGIIANNFVRVAHRVDRSSGCVNLNTGTYPNIGNIEIDGAILSMKHSFTVDNYDCGAVEGTLTVKGVIAQYFRGTVGTTSGGSAKTGYVKNYNYDDLLKYRTPPYFLEPVEAPWYVARTNEQVPAR